MSTHYFEGKAAELYNDNYYKHEEFLLNLFPLRLEEIFVFEINLHIKCFHYAFWKWRDEGTEGEV